MNKSKLKTYAPEARRDFIQAVTQRANLLGLSATDIAPVQITGDIAMINGRPWPASVAQQRELLVKRIQAQGFAAVMEAEAYGWFNRFAALRYMELHGYLDHGFRVLSNSNIVDGVQGGLPEILENAASLDSSSLPGLNRDEVIRLKLDGNKDNELYRLLLTTQCNALADSMGFLFETLGDETELLLPDNLLNTDSVIAKMVNSIDETDWEQVEIIGWLYQFYISDKKDEVIGKVVKSEDIPAATQLFTPNWIVKYLTQNSIGRLWLMANPSSNLASQMAYYIKPAEQTPEVNAQLDALIQTRMAEDGGSLNPETITVLDPACGSGHILVEAYDLLKAIYLERGYQPRAIPRLILEKNLFGLDIDDRAAQLAGFALLMKARADDRRLFENKLVLNLMALQDSHGLDDETMAQTVFDAAIALEGGEALPSGQLFGGGQLETQHSSGLKVSDLRELIQFFSYAKTFGSLLNVPDTLSGKLDKLQVLLRVVFESGNFLAKSYANQIREQFLIPALILTDSFDAVIANPPYMGGKGMNASLKQMAIEQYPDSKSDLFSMFIERSLALAKSHSWCAMITMPSWLFLNSFEILRQKLLSAYTIESLLHLGRGIFGIDFGSAAFVFRKILSNDRKGEFFRLHEKVFQHIYYEDIAKIFKNSLLDRNYRYDYSLYRGEDGITNIPETSILTGALIRFSADQGDFKKIPGSPIAYWAGKNSAALFGGVKIGDIAETRLGMATADNNKFLRFWYEVDFERIGLDSCSRENALESRKKWFKYQKGGDFRKWYGNLDYVVNWENDGYDIQNFTDPQTGKIRSHNYNLDFIFKRGVTWNALSSSNTSARVSTHSLFDNAGSSLFVKNLADEKKILAFMNSQIIANLIKIISPTLNYQPGDIAKLPGNFVFEGSDVISSNADKAVILSKENWDSYEKSFDFHESPLINSSKLSDLSKCWSDWQVNSICNFNELRRIEQENNQIFGKRPAVPSNIISQRC